MSEPRDIPSGGPEGVDLTRPSPARLYDYFLGGTNNFPVDREAAERLRAVDPDVADAMWANRGFHGRAAVWIAEQGIRQFIDIGSGLLGHPGLRALIDFAEPAGVLMTAVVHFVADERDPWGLVARYLAAVAPGSYLALSHGTYENLPPRSVQAGLDTYANATEHAYLRSRAEVERFFGGLELVAPYEGAGPGLTYVGLWGAEDPEAADSDGSRALYCGVARRPAQYAALPYVPEAR